MSALANLAAEWAARGLDAGLEVSVWGAALLVCSRFARRGSAPLAFALLAVGLLVFAAAPLALPLAGVVRIPLPGLADLAGAPVARGWLVAAFAAWATGSLLQGLRLMAGVGGLARSQRRARRLGRVPERLVTEVAAAASTLGVAAPEVLISAEAGAPYVFGPRPKLVVPEGWADSLGPSDLRLALLHELAHLKRGDLGWIALGNLVSLVWWWHPVFWLLASRMRAAQEHVADDLAMLAAEGDEERYCEMLLGAAAWSAPSNAPAILAPAGLGSGALERRIRRLMDPLARRRRGMGPLQRAVILLLAALAIPAAASSLDRDPAAGGDAHAVRHRAAHRLHHHP